VTIICWFRAICVVSQDEKENEQVLKYMERVLEADIRASIQIDRWEVNSARSA
jgi:hypothetical protein